MLTFERHVLVVFLYRTTLGSGHIQVIVPKCLIIPGGGGGTPIHKLYGDVPPFMVLFFDCPLINRVSNSKIFELI